MDINDLIVINNVKIENLKIEINKENKVSDKKLLDTHLKIKKIFEEDKGIFLKISMNESVKILKYLFEEEEVIKIYSKIINFKNYQKLKNKFII